MPKDNFTFFDRISRVVNSHFPDVRGQEDVAKTQSESAHEPVILSRDRYQRTNIDRPYEDGASQTDLPNQNTVSDSANEIDNGTEDAPNDTTGRLLVDIYESDGNVVVQAMIAGVTPENLHISITRERLTLKGKREMPKGINEDQYHKNELYWGEFERIIDLPFEVDPDNAEAVEKYGLLIVRLPRLDISKSQELRVKSV